MHLWGRVQTGAVVNLAYVNLHEFFIDCIKAALIYQKKALRKYGLYKDEFCI